MSPSGFADRAAPLALLSALGCGDPLVDGRYPGEPLFEVAGTVTADADEAPPSEGVRVTALWGPSDTLDWQGSVGLDTTFPARFALTLYAPPPDGTDDTPLGPGLSLGALVLYTDDDHDGAFVRDSDSLVGGSEDRLLVYRHEDAEGAPDSAPSWPDEPGYHMARLVGGDCLTALSTLEEVDPMEVSLYLSTAAAAPLVGCTEEQGGP